jgi:Subtilisin-like serine proteases
MKVLPCLFVFLVSAVVLVIADPGIIQLQETSIDASQSSILANPELISSPTSSGKHQFIIQPKKNFSSQELGEINSIGISLIGIIPSNAYIMLASKEDVALLKNRFELIYAGEYLPEYKTEMAFVKAFSMSDGKEEPIRIRLASSDFFTEFMSYLGSVTTNEIDVISQEPPILETSLNAEAALKLTKRSDVLRVHRRSEYRLFNDVVKTNVLMNVTRVHNDLGFNGKGVTVAVSDTGLDCGKTNRFMHPDFQNKRIMGVCGEYSQRNSWEDLNGHGTHVCGSVCGTGAASDGRYSGIAPEADLYFICIGDESNNVFPLTENDVDKAYENDVKLISNSWGDHSQGIYDTDSELYDTLCYKYPDLSILFGVGNENEKKDINNNSKISTQASAKNVISVGAAESFRPEVKTFYTSYRFDEGMDIFFKTDLIAYPADGKHQGMAAFSSRGPTHDGRIKPDIVAPGTAIISTEALCDKDNAGKRLSYYTSKSGTSMSTPLVSGSAAVVIQYLREQEIPDPSSALVKAVLLNGTRSMGTGQFKGYIEIPNKTPNWVNGFGHLDLGQSIAPTNTHLITIEGAISNTSDLVTYCFNKCNDGPLRVTLVWTDPPSTPGVGIDLINDLDLQVKTKERTYYANNKVGHNDFVNNCETYRVARLAAQDNIEVRVHGYNVMKGPQRFALAITGLDEGPIPEPAGMLALLLLALLAVRKR